MLFEVDAIFLDFVHDQGSWFAHVLQFTPEPLPMPQCMQRCQSSPASNFFMCEACTAGLISQDKGRLETLLGPLPPFPMRASSPPPQVCTALLMGNTAELLC
jgi:hypothetical protein